MTVIHVFSLDCCLRWLSVPYAIDCLERLLSRGLPDVSYPDLFVTRRLLKGLGLPRVRVRVSLVLVLVLGFHVSVRIMGRGWD